MRPAKSILILALCAGVGAGLGSVVIGSGLGSGIGGGVGAVLGLLISALRHRGGDAPLAANMALVLTGEGFELHSLGWGRPSPQRLLLALDYADVRSVDYEPKVLSYSVRIELETGRTLELESGRRGIGAGGDALDLLRSRV